MKVAELTIPTGLPQAHWSLQMMSAICLRPPMEPPAVGVTRTRKAVAWERIYGSVTEQKSPKRTNEKFRDLSGKL